MHYIYKITNLINSKIYIGAHSGHPEDDYLGSGKLILKALKKYGRENFKKEILNSYTTAEEAFYQESILVNVEFILRDDNYNLVPGGTGGSISINRKPFTGKHTELTKNRIRNSRIGFKHSEQTIQKMKDNNWSKTNPVAQQQNAVYAANCRHRGSVQEHSEISKGKISSSLKKYFEVNGSPLKGIPKPTIECPHCKRKVAINTANQWHFDKCKKRV